MKPVLEVLVAELRRLQAHGVQRVSVSEEAMGALRKAVAEGRPAPGLETPAPAPAARAAAPRPEAAPRAEVRATVNEAPAPQPFPEPARPARAAAPKAPPAASLPAPVPFELPAGDKAARWGWLRERVFNDPVCRSKVRPGKQVVLGVGSLDAQVFFVGEAPGAEEEVRGEPFVGPAGELLTKMILAMGVRREEVYIGNIMNWRPQLPTLDGLDQVGNRPPTTEEMAYCVPFLRAQIAIVQPKVLVALGKTAVDGLLGADRFKTLGEARGRWFDYSGLPLMVTYHPSYLLRNQSLSSKRAAWEDLLKVMERVGLPISDKQRGFFLPKAG